MANEIILNGMDGATGDYYTRPMADDQAVDYISDHPDGPETLNIVRSLYQQATQPHLGSLPTAQDYQS